jgi:hypothetical protein
MPFIDIIDSTYGISEPDKQGLRFIHNETTERLERAVLAAQTSHKAGGAVLPESIGYNLPPLVDGLDVAKMGKEAWQKMLDAADWTQLHNQDAAINLSHPDVKAVL